MLMSTEKKNVPSPEQTENERLKRENEALKKVIADLAVDNSILKEANEILKKSSLHQLGTDRQRNSFNFEI